MLHYYLLLTVTTWESYNRTSMFVKFLCCGLLCNPTERKPKRSFYMYGAKSGLSYRKYSESISDVECKAECKLLILHAYLSIYRLHCQAEPSLLAGSDRCSNSSCRLKLAYMPNNQHFPPDVRTFHNHSHYLWKVDHLRQISA